MLSLLHLYNTCEFNNFLRMINLQPLVKSGISYVKSERSRVLKVLQTMAMVDGRSMKNVHDIMSQYSIIGILHALVSSRTVCKQIITRDSNFN